MATRTRAKSAGNTPVKKATRKQSPAGTKTSSIDRLHMISEAAYFLAEQRGFEPGHEMQDWLLAEADIDARLRH